MVNKPCRMTNLLQQVFLFTLLQPISHKNIMENQ